MNSEFLLHISKEKEVQYKQRQAGVFFFTPQICLTTFVFNDTYSSRLRGLREINTNTRVLRMFVDSAAHNNIARVIS